MTVHTRVSSAATELEDFIFSICKTQKEFAEKSGISAAMISQIINGNSPIGKDTAEKLESMSLQNGMEGKRASYWASLALVPDNNSQSSRASDSVKYKTDVTYRSVFDSVSLDLDGAEIHDHVAAIRIGQFITTPTNNEIQNTPQPIKNLDHVVLAPKESVVVRAKEQINCNTRYRLFCQAKQDFLSEGMSFHPFNVIPNALFPNIRITNNSSAEREVKIGSSFANLIIMNVIE